MSGLLCVSFPRLLAMGAMGWLALEVDLDNPHNDLAFRDDVYNARTIIKDMEKEVKGLRNGSD